MIKKIIMVSFTLVLALSFMSAANSKWWTKDEFSIEMKDDSNPVNRDDKYDELKMDWGGIDNYFSWGSSADIYKGDKFKMDFSFWNGWDTYYRMDKKDFKIEPEMNNSLNMHFGDIYHLTIGLRPQALMLLNAILWNGSTNYLFDFQYARFDASLENIIKVPKILDINSKIYLRHQLNGHINWNDTDYHNTESIAVLTAIGGPGIWTGDVYRAYDLWDAGGAWQMGFKNNCGVWPMYSFGLGWMVNSIVKMDLSPLYVRDWGAGQQANGTFVNEQYSVYQKTTLNFYVGICENISKPLGIKGLDIIFKAEEAVNIQMPYATGTEITKDIRTLGYYGVQLGWNGLSFDLMAALATSDSYDKSRPYQKDAPEIASAQYRSTNPSAQLGFATKLKFDAGHFYVFGQYIGWAEIRQVDADLDSRTNTYEIIRNEKWSNYIKIGLGFSAF